MKYFTEIKKQKGVSLIITFFIMTIVLSIVMAISTILYAEIRIIKNMGNSVVAFYAADAGIEKTLYYDRKELLQLGTRGLCNICNICLDCQECTAKTPENDNCDPESCADCHIVFTTGNQEKSYNVDVNLFQQCQLSEGAAISYGLYGGAKRAIKLDMMRTVENASAPNITNTQAIYKVQGETGAKITISADVSDPDGHGIDKDRVKAYIRDEDGNIVIELRLTSSGGGNYSKSWTGGVQGVDYYISIEAYDVDGNCANVADVTITYE